MKRRRSDEQNQPRFKKRAPNHDEPSAPNVKFKGGSNSQGVKTTCFTCGKKQFGKFLACIGGYFVCCKDVHKVRDCPTIVSRGREANKYTPNVPDSGAPKSNRFYVLQAKGEISVDDSGEL